MPIWVITPRKAHVKRIYLLHNNEIDHNVWVDVMRIDEWEIEFRGVRSGMKGLLTDYRFKWLDDGKHGGDVQGENANRTRKTKKLRVHNPSLPTDENETDILLWIVDQMHISFPIFDPDDFSKWSHVTASYNYDNTPPGGAGPPPPAHRKVSAVRVVNNDLNGLDMTKPVDWKTKYRPALVAGTRDLDQYIDVEIPERYGVAWRGKPDGLRSQNLFVFRNVDLAAIFKRDGKPDPAKTLRTDPYEFIVNVNWDVIPEFIALEISPIGVLEQNGFSFVNVWGQAVFGQQSQWVHRFDPDTGHVDWHWVRLESGDGADEEGFPEWVFIQSSIFFPPEVATHLIHHWVDPTFFEIWYSELSQSGSSSIRPTPVPTPDVLPDNVTPITWQGTDVGTSVVMSPGGDGPFDDTFAAGTGTTILHRRGRDHTYTAVGGGLVLTDAPGTPPPFNRVKNRFTLLLQLSVSP